ncbi:Maltose/maltodextrin ABC transporter, permease protein MalG [Olavius sp. associated proteobacterium Delta 1]|nr:Maltose/maltodextrin ABC transporter, permease protein MalG [Olavius sp. associated proteobacterium Delta 1]
MPLTKRKIGMAISAYTVVIVSLIFFLLPMVWIIYCSFRTQASIFTGKVMAPLNEFTLENYQTILAVTDYPTYFLNSFKIAVSVSLLSLVFSVAGAYGLSRFKIRGKNAIIMGIFSTQMFPQVLLIIPMYLIVFSLRMLDTVPGVVLGQLILVLPFSIWMLKGYFDGIPVDIDDAARIDGCNVFQRLVYIILPIGAPGIMVAGFFSFVVSWGDYLIVSIISQSQRTATATLVIQRLSSALMIRWGQVAAAAVLTIVPTVILFSFVQKRLVEGLTAGAIKE